MSRLKSNLQTSSTYWKNMIKPEEEDNQQDDDGYRSPVFFPTISKNRGYTTDSSSNNGSSTIYYPFNKKSIKGEPPDRENQESPVFFHANAFTKNELLYSMENKGAMNNANNYRVRTISSSRFRQLPNISDERLVDIPIAELNKLVIGCEQDAIRSLRKRRRLLKNRIYAQQFRNKRIQTLQQYTEEIKILKQQIKEGTPDNSEFQNSDKEWAAVMSELENSFKQGVAKTEKNNTSSPGKELSSCPTKNNGPATNAEDSIDLTVDLVQVFPESSMISDRELERLSTQDLNIMLKGSHEDQILAVKKRRRLLKSRTYGQRSRDKRNQEIQHCAEQRAHLREKVERWLSQNKDIRNNNPDQAASVPLADILVENEFLKTINEDGDMLSVTNMSNNDFLTDSCRNNKIKQKFPEIEKIVPASSPTPDGLYDNIDSCSSENDNAMMNADHSRTLSSALSNQSPTISDEKLAEISIKELNNIIRECDQESKNAFRRRRRLSKNRSYAQRCRKKRAHIEQLYANEVAQLRERIQSELGEYSINRKQAKVYDDAIRDMKTQINREQRQLSKDLSSLLLVSSLNIGALQVSTQPEHMQTYDMI